MFLEPRQLIGETLGKLETISAYFVEETDERVSTTRQLPVEGVGREGSTADHQDPKLRTAQESLAAGRAQLQFRECLNCE
jgi:hypothetical protein